MLLICKFAVEIMAKEQQSIIGVLCYRLPYELSNQLYNEYDSRLKEATYFINSTSYYKQLSKSIRTVEVILALSIFHKRVISNLDAALKFYDTVRRNSQTQTISIGSYDLTIEESKRIYGILIGYRDLRQRFGLTDEVFEYYETKQFLRQIINFKNNFGNRKNKGSNNQDRNTEEDTDNFSF